MREGRRLPHDVLTLTSHTNHGKPTTGDVHDPGAGPAQDDALILSQVGGQQLAAREQSWRDGVQVVAMDGFTGFKTATTQELPDAVAVMDPFHVVRLAGDALDRCRRRVQHALHGHRGRTTDPLYRARRTLHTGVDLLTDTQHDRLTALFVDRRSFCG